MRRKFQNTHLFETASLKTNKQNNNHIFPVPSQVCGYLYRIVVTLLSKENTHTHTPPALVSSILSMQFLEGELR